MITSLCRPRFHLHFGYTGDFGSKFHPTPGFLSILRPRSNDTDTHTYCENHSVHAYCAAGKDLRNTVSMDPATSMVFGSLTKATADRMSSRPRPIPRIRPRNRKPTTIANKIHNNEIAMSESRALPVMGMGSVLMNMIAGKKKGTQKLWR